MVTPTSQATIQLPSTIFPLPTPFPYNGHQANLGIYEVLFGLSVHLFSLVLLLDFIYSKICGVLLSPFNLFHLACVCVGHSVMSNSMGPHGL